MVVGVARQQWRGKFQLVLFEEAESCNEHAISRVFGGCGGCHGGAHKGFRYKGPIISGENISAQATTTPLPSQKKRFCVEIARIRGIVLGKSRPTGAPRWIRPSVSHFENYRNGERMGVGETGRGRQRPLYL